MKPSKTQVRSVTRNEGEANGVNLAGDSVFDATQSLAAPTGLLSAPFTVNSKSDLCDTAYQSADKILEEKLSLEALRRQRYGWDEGAKLVAPRTDLRHLLQKPEYTLLEFEELDASEEAELREIVEPLPALPPKIIGLVPELINDPRYAIDPTRMPPMSFLFNDLDFSKAFTENERVTRSAKPHPKKVAESKGAPRELNTVPSKIRKSEFPLIVTARMKNLDRRRLKIPRDEDFRTFESIRREPKRVKNRTDGSEPARSKAFEEKWREATTSLLKIMKFFQRSDCDQNAKNLAMLCAKVKRKTTVKTKKTTKEYAVRAKKLWKECQLFWKRRTKELNDLKKKKEKLELEKKKKEEERQEQLRQKKKIEFLIQRSSIYADFMSKKLGTESSYVPVGAPLVKLSDNEESQAKDNVQNMIEDNQKRIADYQREQKPVDFSQVELEQDSALVEIPSSFKGTLKDYQFKGLRWLDNLYTQGINGILADEMGLGKTIQALALLAHISEKKDNWGPFLVIAPATTLFNWRSECIRFCPLLRVLPFWGSKKERKIFRKDLQQKNLGSVDSSFHIVITSYQVAVADEKFLQRVNWQYIILDEAQAIKNMNSQRWSKLLELKSRNKLLLTGTPIQNTMAELWALLHFIMPMLFDSHEQFQEWFSKDIEAHSQNKQKLNKTQLDRLHAILKPFMLRRVKKDVEKEIGKKFEHEIYCELSTRQRVFYESLKKKISLSDFFYIKENRDKVKNLMNLVMQLRKVCNHPDLFERKIVRSPLNFSTSLPEEVHTVYSNVEKLHVLRVNSLANPFNATWPEHLIFLRHSSSFSKILTSQKALFGYMAGATQLQINFFTNPSDFGLLQIVCAAHYLKMNEERIRNLPEPHFQRKGSLREKKTARSAVPYFSLAVRSNAINFINQTSGLHTDKNLISSLALERSLEDIWIPRASAMAPRMVPVRGETAFHTFLTRLNPIPVFKMEYPLFTSIINDASKLQYLDELLRRLKAEGQRALIFCQMTKMLDILEDYLQYRKYTYLRLDGACPISDRRDKVREYQDSENIFIFLLSTRAGGLGVTLTAADVVIFYDNDWNPTMDAQAADRAHRIGRTKDVNVYRLITKHTIEERIMKRAQQKNSVQQTVYSGEVFKGTDFKEHDMMSLLFDEQEIQERERKETGSKSDGRSRRRGKKPDEDKQLEQIPEEPDNAEIDPNIIQQYWDEEGNALPAEDAEDVEEEDENRGRGRKSNRNKKTLVS